MTLFFVGAAKIGSNLITPVTQTSLARITRPLPFATGNVCPQADWMVMVSLRDDENSWLWDFEGDPDQGASAATTPGEIESWLRSTGLYSWFWKTLTTTSPKNFSHAMSLNTFFTTDPHLHDIVLFVDDRIIGPASVHKKKKWSDTPNHFRRTRHLPSTTTAARCGSPCGAGARASHVKSTRLCSKAATTAISTRARQVGPTLIEGWSGTRMSDVRITDCPPPATKPWRGILGMLAPARPAGSNGVGTRSKHRHRHNSPYRKYLRPLCGAVVDATHGPMVSSLAPTGTRSGERREPGDRDDPVGL